MNKEITVVCVSNVHHDLVELAFQKTIENTPYVKDTILFSDKPIRNVNTFVKLKDNFSYWDYNYFVLKSLYFFIKTNYVIIIHPDSMAVNKDAWTDDFFNYDYIGALTEHHGIYNGGFTFRSKKLLRALLDSDIIVLESIKNNKYLTTKEDVIITGYYKKFLEDFYNIRFCNDSTAKKFSTDIVFNDRESFGFHGAHNSLKFLDFSVAEKMITKLYKKSENWLLYDKLLKNYKTNGFDFSFKHFYHDLIIANKNNANVSSILGDYV